MISVMSATSMYLLETLAETEYPTRQRSLGISTQKLPDPEALSVPFEKQLLACYWGNW